MSSPVKVLFVCHGNICRSPMAEFIMKDLVRNAGRKAEFEIASAAVTREEIGNDIYPAAKSCLRSHNVPFETRRARQITLTDLTYYDYIIAMDEENLRGMQYLFGAYYDSNRSKIHLLMEFAGETRDVADPWYTGDFEETYEDCVKGITELIKGF